MKSNCYFLNIMLTLLVFISASCYKSTWIYESKYSYNGASTIYFVSEWGYPGETDGNFRLPRGICSDPAENLYVVDTGNNRIQKFDSDGNFISKWGTSGTANGQFNHPENIAIDSANNIYVTDSSNNRIQKFDTSGNFITAWGSTGTGNSQFKSPRGITCDSSNNIYVTDYLNHRVQKFDSSGNYIMQFGTQGSGNGQFYTPKGIAVDSTGKIYVSDAVFLRIQAGIFGSSEVYYGRIQTFDSSGNYLSTWSKQFNGYPVLFTDAEDNIYVTLDYDDSVEIYDNNGIYRQGWGDTGLIYDIDQTYDWNYAKDNQSFIDFSREGSGDQHGYFIIPGQVAVLTGGYVVVTDTCNYRMQKFQLIENTGK